MASDALMESVAVADGAPAAGDSIARDAAASARARRRALTAIVAAFVVSRLAYCSTELGYRMNLGFHQILDPNLLQSDLIRSIYYLHMQPPLLNFMLGVGLKLFPHSYPLAFQSLFAAIGLTLAITIFTLMTELGVPMGLSLCLTLLFEVGPATLIYENWYYDTYPTATLLCVAALSLNRFVKSGSRLYGATFVVSLAAPVFLNASFQIWWFAGVGLCLFAFGRMRRLLPLGLGMLGLILALYLKNFLVFGVFATSSWAGNALSASTSFQLTDSERLQLVRSHKLSPLALLSPFPEFRLPNPSRTGVPALDEQAKPQLVGRQWVGGGSNCNNLVYLRVARQQMRDALWVVRHHPEAYARGILQSTKEYFQPATYLGHFGDQRAGLRTWCDLYSWLLLAIPGTDVSIVLLLAVPILPAFAVWNVVAAWRGGTIAEPANVTLLFIAVAILYLVPMALFVTCGESSRYRYVIDPLYLVLAGLFLTSARRVRRAGITPDR